MSPAATQRDVTRRSGMIERVTSLIDAVRDAGRPTSYFEVASATSLPPSTTYRLLCTLVAQEWLATDGDRGYVLGPRSLGLGDSRVDPGLLRSAASEELWELSWRLDGVAHLAVKDRAEVHYLDKVSSSDLYYRVASAVGARVPACFTPSGQVLLGAGPAAASTEPHPGCVISAAHQARVLRALDQIETNHGMRVVPAARHPHGYSNIAVPVMGPQGAVAAISIATLSSDIDHASTLLLEASRRISTTLFADPPHPG